MKIIFLVLAVCMALSCSTTSVANDWGKKIISYAGRKYTSVQNNLPQNKAKADLGVLVSLAALATGIGLVAGSKKHMHKIRKKLHKQSALLEVFGPKKVTRLKKALRKYKRMHGAGAAVVSLSTVAVLLTVILRVGFGLIPKPGLSLQGQAQVRSAFEWLEKLQKEGRIKFKGVI